VIALFGDRLKLLRNEKNITQAELAKLLDVSPSTIGMYEQDRRDPDTKTLTFLVKYFNTSVDYLLCRVYVKNPYEIEAVVSRSDRDEFTEEELNEIEQFKEFIKIRRRQNKKSIYSVPVVRKIHL